MQTSIDDLLINATDLQDLELVTHILCGRLRLDDSYPDLTPSLDAVNTCFRFSLASENIDLISVFFSERKRPEKRDIAECYRQLVQEGTRPYLAYFIQQFVDPQERLELYRYYKHLRGEGILDQAVYLPDDGEKDLIRKFDVDILNHEMNFSLKQSREVQLRARIRAQLFVNDELVDAVRLDKRLILHHILHLSSIIRPSQTVINNLFVSSVSNNKFAVAEMLTQGASSNGSSMSANQEAYNHALLRLIDEENTYGIRWLLSGRYGIGPAEETIKSAFRNYAISHHWRPTAQHFRDNRIDLEVQSMSSVLLSYVTPEFQDQVENEIRQVRLAEQRQASRRHLFQVRTVDIHDYSHSIVQESSEATVELASRQVSVTDHRRHRQRGTDLNSTILAHIQSRVPTVETYNSNEISNRITRLITEIFRTETEQNRAIGIIQDLMTSQNVSIFGVTLAFLDGISLSSNRTDVIPVWINGFLTESIIVNSCNPGALERVVTGLRGINDPQLDQIFGQAEGPHLARTFLKGTFNIFYSIHDTVERSRAERNAINLSQILLSRGVTPLSTASEVEKMLIQYAQDAIRSYGVDVESYEGEIMSIVEAISDSFETHLQPFLIAEMENNK